MSWRWDWIGPRFALAFAICATYWGSLGGGFVADDGGLIRDNVRIHSLAFENWPALLLTFQGSNYAPVTDLSLALDRAIWGPDPFGHHLGNLLIHLLAGLFLHRILLRLQLGAWPAFIIAGLWALHPLQVESVAFMSERKNVLSGLFFWVAWDRYLSYSDSPRIRTYTVLLLFYALAVLSKMNTLVLPAVFLAYEWTFRFRFRARDLWSSFPLFALGAAVAVYNLIGNPIHGQHYHGGSLWVTGLSSLPVVMRYLQHVVAPFGLGFFYDVPLRGSLLDPVVLTAWLAILLAITFAFVCLQRRWRAGFWVFFFFITLSPMLNLIPFRSLMQDRYMYLPLAAPLVLIVQGVIATIRWGVPRAVVTAALVVAALGCAGLSAQRVEVFDNEMSLWSDWMLKMHYRPSFSRFRQPDYESKLERLRSAAQRDPASAIARGNWGALLLEAGDARAALSHFERALELKPEQPVVLANLGIALTQLGRDNEGADALRRAAELEPHSFPTQRRWLQVSLKRKDLASAREAAASCERIYPAASKPGRIWERERRALERLEALSSNPG